MSKINLEDAARRGYADAKAGQDKSACPYRRIGFRVMWLAGWRRGRTERDARKKAA